MWKKILLTFTIIGMSCFLIVLTLYLIFVYDARGNNIHDFFYKTTEISSEIGKLNYYLANKNEDIPNSIYGYQSTYYVKTELGYFMVTVFQKKDRSWRVADYEILEITKEHYNSTLDELIHPSLIKESWRQEDA